VFDMKNTEIYKNQIVELNNSLAEVGEAL